MISPIRCLFDTLPNALGNTEVTSRYLQAIILRSSGLAIGLFGTNDNHFTVGGAIVTAYHIDSVFQANGTCCYQRVCLVSVDI